MSGPKSARYILELEQRRRLAEARERERKIRQETEKFRRQKEELSVLKEELEQDLQDIDLFINRLDLGRVEQNNIREALRQIGVAVQEASVLNELSELENLQSVNALMHEAIKSGKKAKGGYDLQRIEMEDKLADDLEANISAGMMLQIADKITEPMHHIEAKLEEIKESLDSVRWFNISSELQAECEGIWRRAQEISNEDFLDNFYAVTVIPFIEKCKEFDEQVEEQNYIAQSFDEVMKDMGYDVVGDREVTKKSGRKFRNELYHFSEGTVVNVTYASNGQISMELGGVDTWDREPSESECDALCEEMENFCIDFLEIEKRLKEKGVILASRISMLPPVENYAQIINISDYDMKKKVDIFEVKSKKQKEDQKRTIRKE